MTTHIHEAQPDPFCTRSQRGNDHKRVKPIRSLLLKEEIILESKQVNVLKKCARDMIEIELAESKINRRYGPASTEQKLGYAREKIDAFREISSMNTHVDRQIVMLSKSLRPNLIKMLIRYELEETRDKLADPDSPTEAASKYTPQQRLQAVERLLEDYQPPALTEIDKRMVERFYPRMSRKTRARVDRANLVHKQGLNL